MCQNQPFWLTLVALCPAICSIAMLNTQTPLWIWHLHVKLESLRRGPRPVWAWCLPRLLTLISALRRIVNLSQKLLLTVPFVKTMGHLSVTCQTFFRSTNPTIQSQKAALRNGLQKDGFAGHAVCTHGLITDKVELPTGVILGKIGFPSIDFHEGTADTLTREGMASKQVTMIASSTDNAVNVQLQQINGLKTSQCMAQNIMNSIAASGAQKVSDWMFSLTFEWSSRCQRGILQKFDCIWAIYVLCNQCSIRERRVKSPETAAIQI